jgi:hypothetical protein
VRDGRGCGVRCVRRHGNGMAFSVPIARLWMPYTVQDYLAYWNGPLLIAVAALAHSEIQAASCVQRSTSELLRSSSAHHWSLCASADNTSARGRSTALAVATDVGVCIWDWCIGLEAALP